MSPKHRGTLKSPTGDRSK